MRWTQLAPSGNGVDNSPIRVSDSWKLDSTIKGILKGTKQIFPPFKLFLSGICQSDGRLTPLLSLIYIPAIKKFG
jgi:hypothetical protein